MTRTTPRHDVLLSAKQIAPMLGYDLTSYKAVYAYLEREGIEAVYLSERRKRFWESDIVALCRRKGATTRTTRTAQPESPPTRFRKQAS